MKESLGAFLSDLFSNFLRTKPTPEPLKKVKKVENVATEDPVSTSRGWGDHIKWHTSLDAGFTHAKLEQKPLMLVVHKSTCHACQRMKALFSKDAGIRELSSKMVMVNMFPWELPPEPQKFYPDGGYVPRFMFYTPNGVFLRDVIYNNNSEYKYAYNHPVNIVENMKRVIDGQY